MELHGGGAYPRPASREASGTPLSSKWGHHGPAGHHPRRHPRSRLPCRRQARHLCRRRSRLLCRRHCLRLNRLPSRRCSLLPYRLPYRLRARLPPRRCNRRRHSCHPQAPGFPTKASSSFRSYSRPTSQASMLLRSWTSGRVSLHDILVLQHQTCASSTSAARASSSMFRSRCPLYVHCARQWL